MRILAAAILIGCVDPENDDGARTIVGLRIDQGASASIDVGATLQLTATAREASGRESPARGIVWSSSSSAVATVTSAGLVTGIGTGSAVISAGLGGQMGTIAVEVRDAQNGSVASVSIEPMIVVLTVGLTASLEAIARDAGGQRIPGLQVVWTSNDQVVATVTPSGQVTARGEGMTEVSATISGRRGVAMVAVIHVPVASVSVEPAAALLAEGDTLQLVVELRDTDGFLLDDRSVAWASSDIAIAEVSQVGLVRAVAIGTATISATSEGRSGSAVITVVRAPVASMSLGGGPARVYVNDTLQIGATLYDARGVVLPNRPLLWQSSHICALVDANGLVTAVAAGTATITASVPNAPLQEDVSASLLVTIEGYAMTLLPLPPGYDESFAGRINLSGQVVGSAGGMNGAQFGEVFWSTPVDPPVVINTVPRSFPHFESARGDLNDAGAIAGAAFFAPGQYVTAVWSGGTWTELETFDMLPSQGYLINEAGIVAGDLGGGRAFVWGPAGRTELSPPPGYTLAFALGMNNAGDVVGDTLADPPTVPPHAVLWRGGAPINPETYAGFVPYPSDPQSVALDINDFGDFVGSASGTVGGAPVARPILWTALGTAVDLPAESGGSARAAFFINNAGEIVGVGGDAQGQPRALLWTEGRAIEGWPLQIANLLPPGWVLAEYLGAPHVNALGQLAATVSDGNETRAAILTPP